MYSIEGALRIKSVGRIIFKWGLILTAIGAAIILIAIVLATASGSFSDWSPAHIAVMGGSAVMLYLGLLPVFVGGLLWIGGIIGLRLSRKRE